MSASLDDRGPTAIDDAHRRPEAATDETVAAVGKVTEAFEWIERARGALYDFHQLIGHADTLIGEASELLRECGHDHIAETIDRDIVGRNVLDGRWTFQVVEEFDDVYYERVRATEEWVRDELMEGRRHVFEAEYKQRRRTFDLPGHEFRPRNVR